ncbi:MAG: hypothetical protein GXY74_11100 [Phycisphaerae bacterium]|nr:hypothetical protein [Phycisphaerae bacterium]
MRRTTRWRCAAVLCGTIIAVAWWTGPARAAGTEPLEALAQMPIREVTIFKDGHAFVRHEGKLPTAPGGHVLMDYLPTPVLGTFWPYSADPAVKLTSVVAGQRKILVQRTALNLRELIEGNVGAAVVVTELPVGREQQSRSYPATILSVPQRSGEELEAAAPPNSGEKLPVKGEVVLLKTSEGVKAMPLARIQDITFTGGDGAKPSTADEEMRNLLTLKLDYKGAAPPAEAAVGMVYLQRGLRWIPSYKVTIDGKGRAHVELQATIINELADLQDATARLVIGVPTFDFKDQVDPIALQQTLADLSGFFRGRGDGRDYLSNAIMSQTTLGSRSSRLEAREAAAAPMDLGPEVTGSEQAEDLFVFTVEHVTLKKGQRMVVPVTTMELAYRDVYTLELPFAPPPEVRASLNSSQTEQLAKALQRPQVVHVLRLENKGDYPLTTAPALILSDRGVLAQGLMTYTSVGGECDLPVTAAVNVKVDKRDRETQRTPNAVSWQGDSYGRVDLAGTITLTNFTREAVQVEVRRHVLGNVTEASGEHTIEMVNVFEDDSYAGGGTLPWWWGWYRWPHWWYHFNGAGRIQWNVAIEPGAKVELTYQWHYYWR